MLENKSYRSLLFVPGRTEKIKNIGRFYADIYLLDLEDSVKETEKGQALQEVKSFLEQNHDKYHCMVRLDSEYLKKQLKILSEYRDIGFMLPKFSDPKMYDGEVVAILEKHEVIALVETPLGVIHAEAIAACKWVHALAFGAEDYASSMGADHGSDVIHYARSRLLTCARAYGKKCYDSPSFIYDDEIRFENELEYSINMGFDGKMAISPKHVERINQRYLKKYDIQKVKVILEEYEKKKQAVLKLDGIVYERMHIMQMKQWLKEYWEVYGG